jgi:hypothetical protein
MRCREVKRLFKDAAAREESGRRHEAALHLAECEECRRGVMLERLSSALLSAHRSKSLAKSLAEPEFPEQPYLMARIKARVRELGEQGVGSWETAVLAMRGWVLALGAAAVLLLAISLQWQLPNAGDAADRDTDVTSLSSIGDDFLSGNFSPSNNHSSEAGGDDHK